MILHGRHTETTLDRILDEAGRRFAIHAVLVLVGGLSWTTLVGSGFALVDGPLDSLITVSLPEVGVELNRLPEHETFRVGDLLSERHAFFGRHTVGFLAHGARAISGVD